MTGETPFSHLQQGQKAKRVFIVHGRNGNIVGAVATIVRSMGLEPLDFGEVRLAESFRGRYIGEVLDHAFDTAQAILVLVSGEEIVRLRPRFAIAQDFPLRTERQPRPNVLVEIGMALRSHAERVIIIDFPPVRQISDLAGLATLKFDGNERKFQTDLSARLKQAGCEVSPLTPVKNDILGQAVNRGRRLSIVRHYIPRISVALFSLAVLTIFGYYWIHPSWCGLDCQEANAHLASGDALWKQANGNNKYLFLYRDALDEYYKALRLYPGNLNYRAHVAAALNDVGEYDRTISEMSPFCESASFRGLTSDAHAWLLGEIAAAFAMKGDNIKAEEYTVQAVHTHPHFRDWVAQTVVRYKRQDEIRRQIVSIPSISAPQSAVQNRGQLRGRIVFTSTRFGNKKQIFMMNADGTNPIRLTSVGSNWKPAFSPDGNKIAFVSDRDEPDEKKLPKFKNTEIYVMNSDGSGQQKITNNPGPDEDPCFSPDGQRIAFHSRREDNLFQIWTADINGKGATRLTHSTTDDYGPAWTSGDQHSAVTVKGKIAYHQASTGKIRVMDEDGTEDHELAKGANPSWSPDGSRIAFWSKGQDGHSNIFVMNARGDGLVQITKGEGEQLEPSWSLDGNRIVFVSNAGGTYDIYSVEARANLVALLNDANQPYPKGEITKENLLRLTEDHAGDMHPACGP